MVYIAYEIPPARHPDAPALRVLFDLLARPGSGRLRLRMAELDVGALGVTASMEPRVGPSRMIFGVLPRPAVRPDAVEPAVEEEILALVRQPPAPEEVEGARNRLIRRALERRGRFLGRADALQRARLHAGSPNALNDDLEALLLVTPADVAAAARRYLTPANRVVVTAVPDDDPGALP